MNQNHSKSNNSNHHQHHHRRPNVGRQIIRALFNKFTFERVKITAKSIGDLVTGPHHPTHACGSTDAQAPVKRPRRRTRRRAIEYEFSCSSTPALFRSKRRDQNGNGLLYGDFRVDRGAVSESGCHVVEEDDDDVEEEYDVTVECGEENMVCNVDLAAEIFIERFYKGLRSEESGRRVAARGRGGWIEHVL
ncbi:hypothetical protein Droror1_Dr00017774 [Drosera rotundifolia]